jgi:hypothetical protein
MTRSASHGPSRRRDAEDQHVGKAQGCAKGPTHHGGNASRGMLAAPVHRGVTGLVHGPAQNGPHQSESIAICDPSAMCRGRTTIKRQFLPPESILPIISSGYARERYLRWSRLSEQIFRVDNWSACQG